MTVREATHGDIPGIARVHVNTWRAAYRGIVPDNYLDSLTYESRVARWESQFPDPESDTFIYVADVDGEVVGFASGGPPQSPRDGYDGELYAIYVAPEYQGKGLGGALFKAVARRLHERGAASMLLWVFRDNAPSRRFYEGLGGELLNEQTFEIAGETMHEVAYAWSDIAALAASE
jgi:GNAT superfamily N-acetyltransferase